MTFDWNPELTDETMGHLIWRNHGNVVGSLLLVYGAVVLRSERMPDFFDKFWPVPSAANLIC